jgi:hypothetical protein
VSPHGTAAYDGLEDLPPLVERALSLARGEGFGNSCRHPATGSHLAYGSQPC